MNPDGLIQLAAPEPFLLAFITRKQQDLKRSFGRDQAGSVFILRPHEHKVAENKVTKEKQAAFKAKKHSTVEPKEMENMLLAMPLRILYIKSFFNGFSRML